MKITFEYPDELFISTTIITGMRTDGNHTVFEGRPFETILRTDETDWMCGQFGFVTSDIKSETNLDNILHLTKIVEFARNHEPVEFLFNIYKDIFCIFYRNKKQWG